MITNLKASIPYAQDLAAKGIRLGLTAQSGLSAVMNYSVPDFVPATDSPVPAFIAGVQMATAEGDCVSEHENFLETMVDELAGPVQSHIRMAREIGAIAKGVADQVRAYLEKSPDPDVLSSFEIVKDEMGSIFQVPQIQGILDSAPTKVGVYNSLPICSGNRTQDQLMEYVTTANPEAQQALVETLSMYDPTFLENIWYGLFSRSIGNSSTYNVENIQRLPVCEGMTVALIGYLIAQKVYDEVPEDAIGSLSTFQSSVADLRDHLVGILGNLYDNYRNALERGTVVTWYEPNARRVVVNGPAYRQWLEQGGSPEIILGSMLGAYNAYTGPMLLENSINAISQWNAYCALHNAEFEVRRARLLRSLFSVVMAESVSQMAVFEEDYRKNNPSHAETVLTKTQQYLDSTAVKQLEDLDATALKLVAGIRFSYTPAELILSTIDDLMKKNSKLDPREAALVAACQYMAYFFVGQVSVQWP